MRLSLIVAMSENRVIGNQGRLPWRLSADLKRFKQLTLQHHIIMGRRTYESIGRLLPGRTSIVITRQPSYDPRGAVLAHSFEQAVQIAQADDEAFVIGGAEIYRLAMSRVDRMYLTMVHAVVDGDSFFPESDSQSWALTQDQRFVADKKNQFDYSFRVYDRVRHEPAPPGSAPSRCAQN